jgi:hypothetical protein
MDADRSDDIHFTGDSADGGIAGRYIDKFRVESVFLVEFGFLGNPKRQRIPEAVA